MNKEVDTARTASSNILIGQTQLLEQLLALWKMAADEDFPVSVFIMDVDKFSLLENKSACFNRILEAIHDQFHRETDFITRFNRKQIIAISSHMSFRQTSQLATRIHRVIHDLEIFHPYSPTGRYATVSIGHHTYTPRTNDNFGVLDLLSAVLKHVRQAKRVGGNCSKSRLHSQLLQ